MSILVLIYPFWFFMRKKVCEEKIFQMFIACALSTLFVVLCALSSLCLFVLVESCFCVSRPAMVILRREHDSLRTANRKTIVCKHGLWWHEASIVVLFVLILVNRDDYVRLSVCWMCVWSPFHKASSALLLLVRQRRAIVVFCGKKVVVKKWCATIKEASRRHEISLTFWESSLILSLYTVPYCLLYFGTRLI